MPERDGYIHGVPCWIDTSQPDPQAAVEFYRGLFGWEFENAMPPDAPGGYHIGRLAGGDVAAVTATPEAAPPSAVWNTYVWVDSADETAATVKAAGGSILTEPFDVMDAGRMAVCADPEGAAFCLWQAGRHKGAQVVNQPGLLNFNTLSTRDLDGASAFYGAVFGWQPLDVGGGLAWRLPGYADFLERTDPGLRERMREMSAPEGFEDAVATINPMTEEPAQTPAHWSVVFAIEDAQATAARAAELGGRVAVAPFDAPWVRSTVIEDPQEATFIANQFVPRNRNADSQPDGAAQAA